jgi:hypothetical protein
MPQVPASETTIRPGLPDTGGPAGPAVPGALRWHCGARGRLRKGNGAAAGI